MAARVDYQAPLRLEPDSTDSFPGSETAPDEALAGEDNTPAGLQALLRANAGWRIRPWPAPFDATTHLLRLGDARDLSWIPDSSVQLVVTSPPYWTLKQYRENRAGQLGDLD